MNISYEISFDGLTSSKSELFLPKNFAKTEKLA